MRLSSKTRTVLDIPLSPGEFAIAVLIGAAMVLTILFAMRPFLRAILGIEAGL